MIMLRAAMGDFYATIPREAAPQEACCCGHGCAGKRSQNAPAPKSSVSEECLFRPDGQRERILTLDANSATFATDLTLVFEKNVARARSEHKKKFGSADRVDPKA
jgi:hypothetical protein